MRRHVSAEVIALLREGEVSARKAGRITAHLSVCADCAGIDSDLAAVPGMLAAVPLPPMPDTITERLQLAIASEATARTAAGAVSGAAPAVSLTDAGASSLAATDAEIDSGADSGAGAGAGANAGTDAEEPGLTPGRPDLPERARGRSWRFRMPDWSSPLVLRGLAAAGAVVVIAGAGLLFVHGQTGQESSSNGSGSGGAAGPRNPAPSAGVPGLSHGRYSALNGPMSLNYRLKGKIATARALTSHHNYTKLNLAPLVHKDVASAASIQKTVPSSSRPASPATFGGIRVPTLIGCLTKIAAGRSVLVADIARYLGRPATIVVLRPSAGSHVLDVVVVGLTCSSAVPDIIAELTVPAG